MLLAHLCLCQTLEVVRSDTQAGVGATQCSPQAESSSGRVVQGLLLSNEKSCLD